MKRTVMTLLAFFLLLAGVSAQKTEPIVGGGYLYLADSLKLDSMYTYWNTYVQLHPKDEVAWRNLSEVEQGKVNGLLYKVHDWHAPLQLRKQLDVMKRMEQAIPGTYTFYYCAHQNGYASEKDRKEMEEHNVPALFYHSNEYADSAIAMLPQDVPASDYDLWAKYLIEKDDTLLLTKVLTQYYESGQYPKERLQYEFNEMQGMEPDGVYLGHTEGDVIGKLILQHVLDVHKDKILYHENLAPKKAYLEVVFDRIGIPFSDEIYQQLYNTDQKVLLLNIMRYIFEQSQRPVYLSAFNIPDMVLGKGVSDELKACLYNEGLTMRYSKKPYNNMAVKRRNVEQRYLLEYLLMSFHPKQKDILPNHLPAEIQEFYYLLLLNDLMPYYKKHNPERHAWLNRLFFCLLGKMYDRYTGGIFIGNKYYQIMLQDDANEGYHYELTERPEEWWRIEPHEDEAVFKQRLEQLKKVTRVLIKTEPLR